MKVHIITHSVTVNVILFDESLDHPSTIGLAAEGYTATRPTRRVTQSEAVLTSQAGIFKLPALYEKNKGES